MRVVAGQAHPFCKGHMVRPSFQGLHEVSVAGHTQFRVGGFQEFRLLGTVRIVTGIAHAIADRRMCMGLDKLNPCIGVAGIADLIHPVFKYFFKIGSMGIVTGSTHVLGKRHMEIRSVLGFLDLRMALEAQFAVLGHKKFLILRSMRPVAGETASFPNDRSVIKCHLVLFIRMTFETDLVSRMGQQGRALRGMRIVAGKAHPAFEGCVFDIASLFQGRHIMAGIAEIGVLLSGFKRLLGPGRIMTGITHPLGHRGMHACFQQLGLFGRVGVVAHGAGLCFDWIAPMGLLERCRPGIVTLQAKGSLLIDQEAFMIRAMGEMAGPAALLAQDFMDDFFLVVFPCMALIAEVASFRSQQIACLRCMGVMALGASPFLQYGMNIGLVHSDGLPVMALITDFVAFFFQEKLRNDPVPKMTAFAFFLLDHGVYILHGEVLIGKFRVAFEAIFLAELHLCRGRPAPEQDESEHKDSKCTKNNL